MNVYIKALRAPFLTGSLIPVIIGAGILMAMITAATFSPLLLVCAVGISGHIYHYLFIESNKSYSVKQGELRESLKDIQKSFEDTINTISKDNSLLEELVNAQKKLRDQDAEIATFVTCLQQLQTNETPGQIGPEPSAPIYPTIEKLYNVGKNRK